MFYMEFQTPYKNTTFLSIPHKKVCKNNCITQNFSTLLYIYIHTKPSVLSHCNAVEQRDFIRNHNGYQVVIKWSYRSMKAKAIYDIESWKMCTYFLYQFEKSLWKWIKMKILFKEFYTDQHLAILHKSETYYLLLYSPRVFFNAMLLMFSEEKKAMETHYPSPSCSFKFWKLCCSVKCHWNRLQHWKWDFSWKLAAKIDRPTLMLSLR